jgi:hypothetical protein
MSNKTIIMCDDDSEVRATYAYTWAWGERGHCSEAGRQRREQLAQTLSPWCSKSVLGSPVRFTR